MTDRTDIHHPEVVEAFAAAWASIDGKLAAFEREADGSIPYDHPQHTGHYEGYMSEAAELLNRAGKRIKSFDLFEALDPSADRNAS
jgi:hypothetical protein